MQKSAFDCYMCYLALRHHFATWNYDYFFYHGKTNTTEAAFHKRRDVPLFQQLASKNKKPYDVLLSHQSEDPRKHISRILEEPDHYIEYQKRIQSLSYRFTQDIKVIDSNLNDALKVEPGTHPLLMRLYLAKKISLETGTIILDLFDHTWETQSKGDILFTDVAIRMKKYVRFIKYNKEKYHQIALDHFRIDDKYIVENV